MHISQVKMDIDDILRQSGIEYDPSKLKGIKSVETGLESEAFIIEYDTKCFVLKTSAKDKELEIRYENEILKHLSQKSTNYLTLESELFSLNDKVAVLYKYFDGAPPQPKDVNEALIKRIAHLHAEMHKLLNDFEPSPGLTRERFSIFDYSFINIFTTDSSSEYKKIISMAENVIKTGLEPHKNTYLPKSIIHEDLELVNILQNSEDEILFIDFGESHYAPIISDIATVIKEVIINSKGFNSELILSYLSNYNKVNPILDDTQLSMIFGLVVRRTLFMFMYLLYRGEHPNDETGKESVSCNINIEISVLEDLLKLNRSLFNFNINDLI